MQIINKQYDNLTLSYDLEKIAPLESILFIDIETTGFSSAISGIYLIGCGYYQNGSFYCKQFFAETTSDEEQILSEFMTFANNYKYLIHFNGNNFDIPFIQDRCKKFDITFTLNDMDGIDLFRRISPYKTLLGLSNCKQKTLEQFLGIYREDKYSGGELISVYNEYRNHFTVEGLTTLLLHNENDVEGMIKLTSILAYNDMITQKLRVTKVNMDKYTDYNGNTRNELIMKLSLPTSLPNNISYMYGNVFFSAEGSEAILKVPVYYGELKYFYANYKDYYYLPEEDQAIHKSVASFVDKSHRKQATASNCYTRVSSIFLQQFSLIAEPFFKSSYDSKELFLEITEDRKKDRNFFSEYASHILNVIAHSSTK